MKLSKMKTILFLAIALIAVCAVGYSFAENPKKTALTANGVFAVAPIVGMAAVVKQQCTIPESELNSLKAKYGKIKILSVVLVAPTLDENGNVSDPGEVYHYAVRRPDPGIMRMLMGYAQKGEIDKFVDVAIKNLIVSGDMDALQNDGLVYMGIAEKLQELIKPYQSFLANA